MADRAPRGAGPAGGLASLPQPMHLYRALTGSQHFHFGCFDGDERSLATAMDQLVLHALAHLEPKSSVLDVGCGMGGTSRLLAERGFRALGIDPNHEVIAFARQNSPASPHLQFSVSSLEDLESNHPLANGGFDNLLLIEVLQHVPHLGELLARCKTLGRTGTVLIIDDIATLPALPLESVPYHRRGALLAAAHEADLEVLEVRDLTAEVRPTPERFAARLDDCWQHLEATLHSTRPAVADEMRELREQLRQLQLGFQNGDLVYEMVALRQR